MNGHGRNRRYSRNVVAAATLLMAALASGAANAQERLVLFGGEVADAAYYSYFGTVLPFGTRAGGRCWFQRYWVDAFGYEYDGGPGRVQADAYGLEAAVGYGGSSERGWWSTSLGLRYTDTSLDPDDPDAGARGSQLGGKPRPAARPRRRTSRSTSRSRTRRATPPAPRVWTNSA